jgi:putative endonuclease
LIGSKSPIPILLLVARSHRRRLGDQAEAIVAAWLEARQWRILATSVSVGRDELDIVATEPGTPPWLVFIEVRSTSTDRFGAPEESVGAAKLARTYRAAFGLLRLGCLPDGTRLPGTAWRVDLVAVDMPRLVGPGPREPRIRHLKGVAVP